MSTFKNLTLHSPELQQISAADLSAIFGGEGVLDRLQNSIQQGIDAREAAKLNFLRVPQEPFNLNDPRNTGDSYSIDTSGVKIPTFKPST